MASPFQHHHYIILMLKLSDNPFAGTERYHRDSFGNAPDPTTVAPTRDPGIRPGFKEMDAQKF